MSQQDRLEAVVRAIGADIKRIFAGYPITQTREESSSLVQWTTRFVGALTSSKPNVAEHYINDKRASWLNEWGAPRGTSPYSWGDALFRAVRYNDDGVNGGQFIEINDRRTGAVHPTPYGRKWSNGDLVRNGITMADTYVTTYADPTQDPNYPLLPVGTHIVVREV